MGNNQNNNNNTANHQSVQHLTNDPNYQQVLRDLYQNNPQQIIQDFPQYLQNQDQHPARFKHNVEVKKVVPKQNNTYIKKDSFKLTQIDASTYQIEFVFECLEPVTLKIHLLAVETINSEFITQKINAFQQKTYHFEPVSGYKFDQFQFDIRQIKLEDLEYTNQEKRQYPLIIEMETQEKSLFQYCFFKLNQNEIQLQTFEIKMQKNGKAFSVRDVYGGQKDQDKDCVICLSNKVNTLILPCKHMSLCQTCCQGLKERSSKCPICRNRISSFRIIMRGQ
ncbi:unnamed protein product [Paramecium pentaurelia]|uniref:RING-type domain-containing protein n=1 Tax=Paramecium pentaurelia TaxID=43138 RepID=A0A8S1UTF1_9CILI|nr:unnamed protein product [Paramecium pentaurelia]